MHISQHPHYMLGKDALSYLLGSQQCLCTKHHSRFPRPLGMQTEIGLSNSMVPTLALKWDEGTFSVLQNDQALAFYISYKCIS